MILQKIQLVALSTLVVAFFGLSTIIGFKNKSIQNLKDANNTLIEEKAVIEASMYLLETANLNLSKSLESQSAAVTEMEAEGKALLIRLSKQNDTIARLNLTRQRKIFEIDGEKVPIDCEAAMDWMIKKATEETK